jgi:hypothetical protein
MKVTAEGTENNSECGGAQKGQAKAFAALFFKANYFV